MVGEFATTIEELLNEYERRIQVTFCVEAIDKFIDYENLPSDRFSGTLIFKNLYRDDYWKLNETRKLDYRRFQPKYVLGNDKYSAYKNALIERTEIARTTDVIFANNLENFYNNYVPLTTTMKFDSITRKAFLNDPLKASLIDTKLKRTVLSHPQSTGNYEYAFDGEKLIKVRIQNGELIEGETNKPYLLVSTCTQLMNEGVIYDRLKTIELRVDCGDIVLVRGVLGCGKSTYIINRYEDEDLVLTTTRAAANDLRERITRKHSIEIPNVRTIDSYIINHRKPYGRVYIDEAIMCHAGDVVAIAHFSKAKEVICLGDTAQIPYIYRTPGIETRYHLLANIVETREFLNTSYRCPVDVIYRISPAYPEDVFSTNKLSDTCKIVPINSLEDVPYKSDIANKDVKYLVFKQSEKHMLITKGIMANTINEFQGSQSPIIKVVRLSKLPKENIYLEPTQALVAISRHTKALIYYTCVVNDALCDLIDIPLPPAELQKIYKNLGGGYCYISPVLLSQAGRLDEIEPIVVDLQQTLCVPNVSNLKPAINNNSFVDGYICSPIPLPDHRLTRQYVVQNPIVLLQTWYDACLPDILMTVS